MSRPPQTATKAAAFLSNALKAGLLPTSLTDLAVRAGVSYATMWKAVRALKKAGKLHGSYRVWSKKPAPAVQRGPEPSPAKRLEERLTRDILSGAAVLNGRLISIKELIARYGTSARTLRRILERIRLEGFVFPHGRHYHILPSDRRQRLKVILIACSDSPDDFVLQELELDFLRIFEAACADAELSLDVAVLRQRGMEIVYANAVYGHMIDPFVKSAADGYLYLLHAPKSYQETTMRALLATGKPVAVLDQAGVFPVADKRYDHPRLRIFTASGREQPGKSLARYLLTKGHRHCAFISPFHGDAWSRNRCDGLKRVFALAGGECSLSEFTHSKSLKAGDLEIEGATLVRGKRLQAKFAKWQRSTPANAHWDTDRIKIAGLRFLFMQIGTRQALYELLDQAVKDRRITAWVLPSDFAARMALQYCREKSIAVPGKIAITAFCDSPDASTHRITSYNFNFNAVASSIINFLAHPSGVFWSRRRVVEIEGKVVERETG